MSPRDYQHDASQTIEGHDAAKRWVRARIEVIHQRVTAHDVLNRFGVRLRYGDGREEQFACPFHGHDNKPSARVYPESNRGPSGAWCFVCQERWDAISLWKKFTGYEGRFTGLLAGIEREYGIVPPESPPTPDEEEEDALAGVYNLFTICESRLKSAKAAFDMRGFLMIGTVLDRLYWQVENKRVTGDRAREVLQQVLDKIGEKRRACRVD